MMNKWFTTAALFACAWCINAHSETVEHEIQFSSRGATLSGTLVLPKERPIVAAAVLIHGSGPQLRMLPLARLFASDGIALLTYDKRGVGQSGGVYEGPNNISAANLTLLADDAAAAHAFAASREELRGVKIGFVGMSQAGWIAPLAAGKSKAAFMALWSAPACTVSEELHFSTLAEKDPQFWKRHSAAEVARYMKVLRYRDDDVNPIAALYQLSIPGLWIFGGQDNSIPVDLSVRRLEPLITDGYAFEYEVVPELGHLLVDATYPLLSKWIKMRGAAPVPVEEHIARIRDGILPVVMVKGEPVQRSTLAERMAALKVPGVSIAVIRDGKIDWARGFGVASIGGPPVTPDTLFQAASISKAVTALGAMRLVEQGRILLDADVNTYLKAWKVPESPFLENSPVTLRGLLTHTAGVTVHGFRGYESNAPVPTTVQVLNGQAPANSPAVAVSVAPGSGWQYSGGGYTIVQQLLSDVTGEPFPVLMQRLVLKPLGMWQSTFEQILPDVLVEHIATPYRYSGEPVNDGPHLYPEMAAAGLWTTPVDLARFAMEIQRSPPAGMLTAHLNNWGLGFQLGGSPEHRYFSHGGGNEGFRSLLIAYTDGDGAVIMTNSEGGADDLLVEVVGTIASEYGWPDARPPQYEIVAVKPEALDTIAGRYDIGNDAFAVVVRKGNSLFISWGNPEVSNEIFPISETDFFCKTNRSTIKFVKNANGEAEKIVRSEGGFSFSGVRIAPGRWQ